MANSLQHGCRYQFRQFKLRGIWTQLLDSIAVFERERQERQQTHGLLTIDSQSVNKMPLMNLETGIDGKKKINGRKRTIPVDMIGIPWSIKVTAANISDNQAGIQAVEKLKGKVPRLQKITADNGYNILFRPCY